MVVYSLVEDSTLLGYHLSNWITTGLALQRYRISCCQNKLGLGLGIADIKNGWVFILCVI